MVHVVADDVCGRYRRFPNVTSIYVMNSQVNVQRSVRALAAAPSKRAFTKPCMLPAANDNSNSLCSSPHGTAWDLFPDEAG